jgi:hypothetical protein
MNKLNRNPLSGLTRGTTIRVTPRWPLAALLITLLAAVWLPAAGPTPTVKHGISAGLLKVEEMVFNNSANTNVNVYPLITINEFIPIKADKDAEGNLTWNTADYYFQIGDTYADDVTNGIVIASIAESGRTNYTAMTTNCPYPIPFIHDGPPYRICSHISYWTTTSSGTTYSAGSTREYNVNVAAAYFPFNKFLGGLARNINRVNNGSNNLLIASSQLVLGTHFIDLAVTNENGGWAFDEGKSRVDLTSLGINSQTDGILLVNHGKDEGNFALSHAEADGTWSVYVHDATKNDADSWEQDPVAFVYIPRTNTDIVSGKFNADASISMYSGGTPQFTVDNRSGRYYLQMRDYAATNGVLIISAEGGTTGLNLDNTVRYEITDDGLGWIIETRDAPVNGLQSPYEVIDGVNVAQAVASFVFIPAPTKPSVLVNVGTPVVTSELGGTNTLVSGTKAVATNSFTVCLSAKPSADVTINVSSSDTTEAVADVTSLTFNQSNWWNPQTVVVNGQDDADVDGSVAYTIVLSAASSTDTNFNGLDPEDVSGVNLDNEAGAGILVGASGLITTESGGKAAFQVRLETEPTADVTVGFSSSDTTEGTVSPASLTFTAADWTNAQAVIVTGVDDALQDGDVTYTIVTAAATSADPAYSGLNPLDVSAVNLDDEAPGVSINPLRLTVNETGTTASFTVALQSPPAANVTISFTSGDNTEGTVSPASQTFTSANWSTPQTFTLTGVNDTLNDGTISFLLTGTASSSDAGYNGMVLEVAAATVDNEAELHLPSGTVIYGIGWSGYGIDGQAIINDTNRTDYNGGALTVALTVNGTADDRLGVRNTGNDYQQVGVSGNTVSYSGTAVATLSGGTGTTPLVISFNSASTPEAAQAILRNVTFFNVNKSPSTAIRTVTVSLADGDGGTATASKQIAVSQVHVCDFQQNVDSGFGVYQGAGDIEIRSSPDPYTGYPEGSVTGGGMGLGWGTSSLFGPDQQVLLKFDSIFGTNSGQIPEGSIIIEANLMLNVINSGDGCPMARMLIPWNADGESWAGLAEGVNFDGIEADTNFFMLGEYMTNLVTVTTNQTVQIGVADLSGNTGEGIITVSVLPDVQYWASGGSNYGWVMTPWRMSADYMAFSACEATDSTLRPRLVVKWVPGDISVAAFRQGVNDYTNASDMRIRRAAPDADLSADASCFVDFEYTTGMEDPDYSLLRFDNIFGDGAGQVPMGATVHAAILTVGDILGNSTGDGGSIHRMLIPWQATNGWNFFGDGVQNNGVEAAITPTASAGDPAILNPNVSGGFLTFDLSADVQAWANGAPNYGWVFLPWLYAGDGWGFASSDHSWVMARPQLQVFYTFKAIAVRSLTVGANSVDLKFAAEIGKTYSILRTDKLGGTWTKIGSAIVEGTGLASYSDTAPLVNGGFYRISDP